MALKLKRKKHTTDGEEGAKSKKKMPNKKIVIILVIAALIVGGYLLINRGDSGSKSKANDFTNNSSSKKTNATPYSTRPTDSKSTTTNKTEKRVPSSSGRINLSGTIVTANDKTIEVKTANGDTRTFSVAKETRVRSQDGKSIKITEIKGGQTGTVTVSVRSDGSFEVIMVRLYS